MIVPMNRSRRTLALPPNRGMELTAKSVTPFARRIAKGAPLFLAAYPRCYAADDVAGAAGDDAHRPRFRPYAITDLRLSDE
jgi:hypothetical protein